MSLVIALSVRNHKFSWTPLEKISAEKPFWIHNTDTPRHPNNLRSEWRCFASIKVLFDVTFWDLCRHNRTALFRVGSTQSSAFGKRVKWNRGCNHSNAQHGCFIFQNVTCGSVVHGRVLHSKEKTMYAATSHACRNTCFLWKDFFFCCCK